MRRNVLSVALGLVYFFCSPVVPQALAHPAALRRGAANKAAVPPQSSDVTVYYCASSWDQRVVYFSAPFETDELARTKIQEAYTQFLKQKYSYAAGASSVVCSVSQTLVSAQSDKSDDEDSVKRSNHTAMETGWTYRAASSGATAAPASASSRNAPLAVSHPVSASAHTPTSAPHPVSASEAASTASPSPAIAPVSPVAPPAAHSISPVPPAANPGQSPAASASGPGYYTLCRFQGQKDGHPIMYVTPIIHTNAGASTITQEFYTYVTTTYDVSKVQYAGGYCRQVSSSTDQQAFTMSTLEQQWAASKTEVTHIDWTDTPAEVAATNAKKNAPPVASAEVPAPGGVPSSPGQSGMPFISCSTSGGAGIDTYLTGVFQTSHPVKHLPSGGVLVDQSVLDRFCAYLTQKGYKFKPGSNYGCDVKPTEAEAKAAQHKRAYEGGACSNCGKVVETGWKDE